MIIQSFGDETGKGEKNETWRKRRAGQPSDRESAGDADYRGLSSASCV